MAKILFNETTTTVSDVGVCVSGVMVGLSVYLDKGINIINISKLSSFGRHDFVSYNLQNNDNVQVLFDSGGLDLSIRLNCLTEAEVLTLDLLVILTGSKLNLLKAEINNSDIVDYLTIDCVASAPLVTPTATSTGTPTVTPTHSRVHDTLDFDDILIYDENQVLEINDVLYSDLSLNQYNFDDLIAINSAYDDSNIMYVRRKKENVIYVVGRSENNVAKVIDYVLCPSPTPTLTPTHTPTISVTSTITPTNTLTNSPTQTPTNTETTTSTPTNTLTPSNTLTNTPSLSQELLVAKYFISDEIDVVCELPPTEDNIIPYHTTKKFRIDRYSESNEILNNEFVLDCSEMVSFIVQANNLRIGNTYKFQFSIPHKSEQSFVLVEPNNQTFVATSSAQNINIIVKYTGNSNKFLVRFNLCENCSETSGYEENEFFIFQCG